MKILREAGNLDWADVTAVRKLITKKQGAEKLAGIKERFLQAFKDDPELGERYGTGVESLVPMVQRAPPHPLGTTHVPVHTH